MIIAEALLRRIEASAARVSLATVAGFVERAPDDPARGAAFGSGALVAFGPGRYVNRAIGVTADDLDDVDLDELEQFYAASGLAPSLEVTSWASAPFLARLARRGYAVEWFRNVYARDLHADDDAPPTDVTTDAPAHGVTVRDVTPEAVPEWLAVLAAGFGAETPDERRRQEEMACAGHAVAGASAYLVDIDGVTAGCGSLTIDGGVAWLGGTATRPVRRRRGAQSALVRHRLDVARTAHCDLAVATAMPAGDSARNLLRLGFTLVDGQAVMTKRM